MNKKYKKRSFLLIFLFSLALTGCDDESIDVFTYGRILNESKYETASGILEVTPQKYLITGTTSLLGNENNGYVLEIDDQGHSVSETVYSKPGDEYYYVTRPASDGGYINLGVRKTPGLETYDIYITKMNDAYKLEWERSYGNAAHQDCKNLIPTSDGGYAIIGNTKFMDETAGSAIYLLKIDNKGNIQWEQTFGTNRSPDTGAGIIQLEDGGFMICGTGGNPVLKAIVIRTDASGKERWIKRVGGDLGTHINSMTVSTDNDFLIAGMRQVKVDATHINYKAYLLKIDANGNIAWEKTYGQDKRDVCLVHSIDRTPDNNFVLGGMSRIAGEVGTDMLLLKVNKNGRLIWEIYYDDHQMGEYGNYVLSTSTGAYILAGFTSRRVERATEMGKQILYLGRYGYIVQFNGKGQVKNQP